MISLVGGKVLIEWIRTLEGDHRPHVVNDDASIMMVEVDDLPELRRCIHSYLWYTCVIIRIILLTTFVLWPRGSLELLALKIWRAHKLLILRKRRNSETSCLIHLGVMMLDCFAPVVETTVTIAILRSVIHRCLLQMRYLISLIVLVLNRPSVGFVAHGASLEPWWCKATWFRNTLPA